MGQSWTGLRKELEENFICDTLKGRVKIYKIILFFDS